jgi:hypothetical protein
MKKVILSCLITLYMASIFGMEQSPAHSSLTKDFMEELPIDYFSSLPKEIKKLVVLNLGAVKGIRSVLETSKENAKLVVDPIILSHLLSLIFKMDDTTRENIKLFLEAHKDKGMLLNDPMTIGSLITKIAEPYAREVYNERRSGQRNAKHFNGLELPLSEVVHFGRYLGGYDVPHRLFVEGIYSEDLIKDALKSAGVDHVELLDNKDIYAWWDENAELYYYVIDLACHRVKVAMRLGTESAAKWLKEYATNDKMLRPQLIQLLIQDYFLESIKNSNVQTVKFLLKSGVHVNVKDSNGYTPFALVRKIHRESPSNENTAIAEILRKTEGIDLSDIVKYEPNDTMREAMLKSAYHTQFHRFIQQFKHKEAQALIEDWVDINVKGDLGNTPLMAAIWVNNSKMALMLIDKGANLSAVNNKEQTALDLARKRKNKQIENAILAKIAKASDTDGAAKLETVR